MSKRKASVYGGSGFVDPDELFTDEEEQVERPNNKKQKGQRKHSPGKHNEGAGHKKDHNGRTRPTNNQLLYKAYFRWMHYPCIFKPGSGMPTETDACASVTSAFLQVLQTLQAAEQHRSAGTRHQRSVLQILSTNTRRTKVVELSSGTHRVPEELKKHYLSDGEGGQYSTNLDRNRYGNDDNYLFTVIRYDLEFLGLCPCMVDVEIIDAKAGNQSVIVSAGPDACTCQHKHQDMAAGGFPDQPALNLPVQHAQHAQQRQPEVGPHHHHHHDPPQLPNPMPDTAQPPIILPQPLLLQDTQPAEPAVKREAAGNPAPAPTSSDQPLLPTTGPGHGVGGLASARLGVRSLPARSRDSPRPSGSGMSQLFDALVMAATGGAEGAAAAGGLGGEPPVTSAFLNALPAPGADEPGVSRPQARGPQLHHAPMRNKSRLWSAMSFGDMDSLQNALDAFRAEEEIASQPYTSSPDLNGGQSGEGLLRQRRRKPPRGNSSFLLRATDSIGDISLSKLGIKFDGDSIAGLTFDAEKSGDNQEAAFAGEVGTTGPDADQPADSQGDEHVEGGGTSGEVVEEVNEGRPMHERSRFRHVPRQASAVNLSTRVSAAEVSRLRQELEQVRAENKRLAAAGRHAKADDALLDQVRQLEAELASARDQATQLAAAKKAAEEQLSAVSMDLNRCRHDMQVLVSKVQHQQSALAQMAHLNQLAAAAGGAAGPGSLLAAAGMDPTLAALAGMNNPATALGAAMLKQQMLMQGAGHGGLGGYQLQQLLAAQQAHAGLQGVHDVAASMMAGHPDLAAAAMMMGAAGNHHHGGGGASGSAGPHWGRSGPSGSLGGVSGSGGTGAGGAGVTAGPSHNNSHKSAATGGSRGSKGRGADGGGQVEVGGFDGDVQQRQE